MTENNDTANDEMRVIYVEVSRWLVLSLYADREAGRTVCLRAGGGSPYESKASWHDWVSGNAEGSVSRRRPSPCDYIRSSSRPSHMHRLLRSRRLPHSRTASWVSQGTSTDSRDSCRCTDKGCFRRIEKVADRPFEGEEAVLHVMGWVGQGAPPGRFVDGPSFERLAAVNRLP